MNFCKFMITVLFCFQVHERARQGCLRAKFMREIRAQEEREKMLAMQGASTMDPDVASTIIQKVWKGYSQRNKTLKLREEELIFIGMQPSSDTPTHHKDSPVSKVSKREVPQSSKVYCADRDHRIFMTF